MNPFLRPVGTSLAVAVGHVVMLSAVFGMIVIIWAAIP